MKKTLSMNNHRNQGRGYLWLTYMRYLVNMVNIFGMRKDVVVTLIIDLFWMSIAPFL